MKILVAYDGSKCSESALDDLNRAGLPPTGEVVLITVAEVWLPPPGNRNEVAGADSWVERAAKKHRARGIGLLNEAGMLSAHAVTRLRKILPKWKISEVVVYGSPACEIIAKSDEIMPDLIVLGSHGYSSLNRLILGSTSQKVLSESAFSVRVARGKNEVDPAAERIIIGFDGSPGSNAAVESVSRRFWSPGAEAKLVSATDTVVPSSIGRFLNPVTSWAEEERTSDYKWVADLAKAAARTLEGAGLSVKHEIIEGNPKAVLIREAENWGADSIFVGATAHKNSIGRFILGSTASALAARSHCSVEVVRDQYQP